MKLVHSICATALCLLLAAPSLAQDKAKAPVQVEKKPPAINIHPSIKKEAQRAIDIGLRWLKEQQQKDGHWSIDQFPAVTALVVQAHLNDPSRKPMEVQPHVRKALKYILSCVRKDGGIYKDVPNPRGGGLRNYNTSICMAALAASGDITYDPIIRKARDFVISMQNLKPGVHYGGFGYDKDLGRAYADMTNTVIAVESIRFTEFVVNNNCAPPLKSIKDRQPPADKIEHKDVDWDAAVKFLTRCQNLKTKYSDHPIKLGEKHEGGSFYEPKRGQTEEGKDALGRQIWNSYGTASYGALMCFLLADVKKDDPRVKGTIKWIGNNWTLKEHPGQGQQGLYFYYHTIAKALRAYGEESLTLKDGKKIDWRSKLAVKLISLQKIDPKTGLGHWVNTNGRWMENDPVLATAYSVLALEMLISETGP
jgi:squalene-hopene/tetraprenyl-beta-curcumene cyclase